MDTWRKALLLGGALGWLLVAEAREAEACGCFTPPDPTVPVVQAGERILFASSGGEITAHIQIQYAGEAKDFGWLLPLPSVPTLELGSDEVFTALINQTQPQYRVTNVFPVGCNIRTAPGAGFQNDGNLSSGGETKSNTPTPLVVQDSIGPYDYAVLKADSKEPMLKWLDDNRYFVPTGTQQAVDPYIRPGSFFLALKLKGGKATGDLQPVVVRYASDLPMIPIVLTSVGANPNMGVQVFMLGAGRAIPRNYHHTVINDALLDWLGGLGNYNDVIIRAVGEAPKKHSFVTEYAGTARIMDNVLDGPGRWGTPDEVRAISDAGQLSRYLRDHRYTFVGPLLTILQKHIAMPQKLIDEKITPAQYYRNIDGFKQSRPDAFVGVDLSYNRFVLTDEVFARVVQPARAAANLIRQNAALTRLYTTISPEDMTRDPVFSFNPELPNYSHLHEAKQVFGCDGSPSYLRTEQGFIIPLGPGRTRPQLGSVPASLRTEVLRESGAPEVLSDNRDAIEDGLHRQSGGCTVSRRARVATPALALLLLSLGALALRRRRGRD